MLPTSCGPGTLGGRFLSRRFFALGDHAQRNHGRPAQARSNPYEVLVDPLLVEHHVVEVLPDPVVLGAAVCAADPRTILVHPAVAGRPIIVDAEAFSGLPDRIRLTQVPPDLSALDLLG